MPEGDTLFRIATTLTRALAGEKVTRFETGLAKLANIDRDAPIAGRTIERIEPRGKFLLIHLSGPLTLLTHLRMNGAWHIYRHGERWQKARVHARIVLETEAFVAVGFDIPVAEFLTGAQLTRDPRLASQGPDLLAAELDLRQAIQRLRAQGGPIGEALLDQRVLAGIGNIYKCETLFLAGVDPSTPISKIDDRALGETVTGARKLLSASANGESLRRWVYDRAGLPCRRCGSPIHVSRTGENARATWWCPTCQPA
jgi:endonuclease VIII